MGWHFGIVLIYQLVCLNVWKQLNRGIASVTGPNWFWAVGKEF